MINYLINGGIFVGFSKPNNLQPSTFNQTTFNQLSTKQSNNL
ncbi:MULTISPECIES: hypothetical protein [Moorena]|uniref:Uncharacterized protein n=1 Tax=Moorena producens 3L TaxID=489825 RepID=F4XI21_9CYAN|nr:MULTISPECIES: hypothetical protein [Moorena]EGJ35727.1 hypothetical protein LYNGBM3L_00510 [Moorena producens 3L]